MVQWESNLPSLAPTTGLPRRLTDSGKDPSLKMEKFVLMLYDSTKVLIHGMLQSLRSPEQGGWDDHVESGGECLYEIHQMARPRYQGYRADAASRTPALVPVYERAARAIPHVKSMVKAIRRKDQAAAVQSGTAALAEM